MTRPSARRHTDRRIELIGLRTLPEVKPGEDVARLVWDAARRESAGLETGDALVLAQKIFSKAEGRIVRLRDVAPSALAQTWAQTLRADPRFVEIVLRESRRIIRMSERALIVETRHGFVCANAGVDRSNVRGSGSVTCLPFDPDASAQKFVKRIKSLSGARVAAIISDTFGRPWRLGLANVAIGAAGFSVLEDLRGRKDASGHLLNATILAVADELAAAAGLVMKKSAQVPVVIIRGARLPAGRGRAQELIRPPSEDMFR
ncbi:MAG TPA: coenzyme F420-0:L-glutamate ligase [Candidatus Acidoferrales bacterium]